MDDVNVIEHGYNEIESITHAQKKSAAYDLCKDIINEIIQLRQSNHMSQYTLAEKSGVRQPMIARIERGINTPNMSTVLRLLAAFGKTLYIGDLTDDETNCRQAESEIQPEETDADLDIDDADAAAVSASADVDEANE